MGLLTETERQEFEVNCAQYPEITAARNAFEISLEDQLLKDAKPAPQHLKQLIQNKIKNADTDINDEELVEERTPIRSMGIWKWMAAASLILFAGAGYWAVTTNNKYENLVVKNKELQNQLLQTTARLDTMNLDAEMLQNPGVKMAALKSKDNATAYATIYWDTASASKDVYLMINNLPQTASDKQYQLWALLDGKPIDLGMIEVKQRLLYRMKNVQNAQAFAITLEPTGGSLAPTTPPISVSNL